MTNIGLMITSLVGITGLYLKNPNFNKLIKDMKKYRNTLRNVNDGSVDVFKYVDKSQQDGTISNKEAKMIFDLLLLFRSASPNETAIRAGLMDVLTLITPKLRKHLDASIIMLLNGLTKDNIEDSTKLIYSYSKRKKVETDFVRYYIMARSK